MNLSEDGGRVAFLARNNDIYRDGELYRSYGFRQVSFPLSMSGDGSVLAWRLSPAKWPGFQVVVNGVEGPVYARTSLPVLSHDGNVVAYSAADSKDRSFIVVNGTKISGDFEEVSAPAVSRDGRVVAYAAEEGDKARLFVGGKRIDLSEMPQSVFLSRDGSTWGCVTKGSVVTDRGAFPKFEEIQTPEFSPDGKRVAFAGRQEDRWFVGVDGRTHDAPGFVAGPIWSADGSQLGYGALLGRELWWKVIEIP